MNSEFPLSAAATSPTGALRVRRRALAATASASLALGLLVGPVSAASAVTAVATDSMTRTVAGGWSAATVGGSYDLSTAANFSVNGTYGIVKLPTAGRSEEATLSSASARDVDARVAVALKALPTAGGGTYSSLLVRATDGYSYRLLLRFVPDGTMRLTISRFNGSPSNITALTTEYVLPQTAKAGQWVNLALSATGTTTVDLKAKAWPAGAAEPAWQLTATDSSAGRVATAGPIKLHSYTSGSSGAAELWYDNLAVTATEAAAAPITTSPTTTSTTSTSPTTTSTTTTSTTTTSTSTTTAAPAPTAGTAGASGAIGSSGSATVGSARYPVPSSAVYVAPNGSDSASGSASAPLRTVTAAINKAPSGATLVLRAGTYHESITIPGTKVLTIQNYPGEAVWFDGSKSVSAFVKSGTAWRLDNWTAEFDASPTYTFGAAASTAASWGTVDPAYPMASHPDQVWLNGAALKQVGSLSQVVAGAFYADYTGNRLYLGSDPTAKSALASDIAKAISIRSAGSTLRGVGVRRYAPSIPHMGAVTAEKPNITIENVVLSDNATTGLSLLASGITVKDVSTIRNGMLGIHANNADGLKLTNVLSADNNTERFNRAPVSGGFKVSRTRGVTISNSTFQNNLGTGIWFDESAYDVKVLNSITAGNSGHGVSVEISAKAVIANSYVANNGGQGLKINNVNGARIWNNTIVGNGRPINIVQDTRRASNLSTPGHDSRQTLPDPTVTWITKDIEVRNNVISNTTSNCLLCVEDYSKEYSAEQMRVTALGNVYQRDVATKPSWLVIWSKGAAGAATFTTLPLFKSGTGQEAKSLELIGTKAVDAAGRPTAAVTGQVATIAQSLPADIAAWTGKTTGAKQLGVFW